MFRQMDTKQNISTKNDAYKHTIRNQKPNTIQIYTILNLINSGILIKYQNNNKRGKGMGE